MTWPLYFLVSSRIRNAMSMAWVTAIVVVVGATCSRSENGSLFRLVVAFERGSVHYKNQHSIRLMQVSTNSFDPVLKTDLVQTSTLFLSQASPSLKCFDSFRYSNRKIRACFCKEFYQKNDCSKDGNGEGTSYRPKNLKWDKVCAACCCLRPKSTPMPTPEFSFSPSPSPGSVIVIKPLDIDIFSEEDKQNHPEIPRWIETSVSISPSPTSTSTASTLFNIIVSSEENTKSQLELPQWTFFLISALSCISFILAVFVIIYLLFEARKRRKEENERPWREHGLKYEMEVLERGGGTMYI